MRRSPGATHALPAGVPTLVFTDIEGSTRLVQNLGDRWAPLLETHRALLRRAWTEHGGVEVGTEGDSFFVAFDDAARAVAAARHAQLGLADHPWPSDAVIRVRIGMHTGPIDVVNDDYVGLTVHVAARVCAIGHGGQILLSDATRALVPHVEAHDHGEHRLKDLRRPVRVFQLLDPALPADFPALRSLTGVPNNLPLPLDDFVGRTTELHDVARALRDHRLVTLTGMGGTGKTRLALELATRLAPKAPGGVWLVELASTQDGSRIDGLVAAGLDLAEQTDRPMRDTLFEDLRDRALLLVLDNCEHLVAEVAAFSTELLDAAPRVRILATSRERLGVRGEHAFAVPPLALPLGDSAEPDSDAVRLFVQRATAMSSTFAPDEEGMQTIAAICRRLDGLPLAIELAAARVRALSLDQLADRLDDRFRLLTDRRHGAIQRQATLETVVAWSHDLLETREQHLFRRLSVFPDSFTLEAAEAVAAGPPVDRLAVLDVLTALLDKSLLVPLDAGAGPERYSMLETLRAFGRVQLEAHRDLDRWQTSLGRWAIGQVDLLEAAMRTPAQDEALRRIRPEHTSLLGVMTLALDQGDRLTALRIASAVPVALPSQRVAMIDELLAGLEAPPAAVLGQATLTMANLESERGAWDRALAAGRRAEAAFDLVGDRLHSAWARYFQVHPAWGTGDLALVDHLCDTLLVEFRDLDAPFGIAYVSWVASLRAADPARAASLAADAVARFREIGADHGLAHALEGAALISVRSGAPHRAVPHISEALELFRRSGSTGCTAHALEAAAACIAEVGDLEDVAEITGAAEAFRESMGHAHRPWELRGRAAARRALAGGDPRLDAARARGRTHSLASAAERAAVILAAAEAGNLTPG